MTEDQSHVRHNLALHSGCVPIVQVPPRFENVLLIQLCLLFDTSGLVFETVLCNLLPLADGPDVVVEFH